MNPIPIVLITGAGYGLNNLGDEAFLSVIIQRFRSEIANARIIVLSFNPDKTKKIHNVEAYNALGLSAIILLMKSNKIVLGGGGIFDTYIGGSTNRTSYYSLMISILATFLRKDVIFYAIGANSLFSPLVRLLLPFIMNHAEQIKVRDQDSKEMLKSIGVKKDIEVIMDPAIDLQIDKEIGKNILSKQGVDLNKILIGFALRHTGNEHLDKDIIYSISMFIDWLIEERNAEIIFIPMAKAEHKQSENDLLFANKIELFVRNKDKYKVITSDLTPMEAKSIVSCMDLLIGMRLHSLIFAYSTNVPFIGISYSKKVTAFLKSVGEEGVEIKSVSFEKLKEKISQV